jgi:hypothetical protein
MAIIARACIAAFLLLTMHSAAWAQVDPLPSWNRGDARTAVLDFVSRVTKSGGPEFVPAEQRIAVFDNDGTLWAEQPIYFQFAFAIDRFKALASQHPEWSSKQPFRSLLTGDNKSFAATGEKGRPASLGGIAQRDDNGGILKHCPRLDRNGAASTVRPAVPGLSLSAHA